MKVTDSFDKTCEFLKTFTLLQPKHPNLPKDLHVRLLTSLKNTQNEEKLLNKNFGLAFSAKFYYPQETYEQC